MAPDKGIPETRVCRVLMLAVGPLNVNNHWVFDLGLHAVAASVATSAAPVHTLICLVLFLYCGMTQLACVKPSLFFDIGNPRSSSDPPFLAQTHGIPLVA